MNLYSPALFSELYKHMEWADATLWRAALAAPGAHSDEMLRNYLHHMHLTQQLFLAFWTGTPAEPIARRQPSEFTLPELCAWAQPYYRGARTFLEAATPDVMARPLVMPWVAQYQKQLGRTFEVATVAETASRWSATPRITAPRPIRGCAGWAAIRRSWISSPGSGSAVRPRPGIDPPCGL